MRIVACLIAVSLTGSLAYANEAKPQEAQAEAVVPKVGLRVVTMLPETHQALLYDKHRGTHVLAEVGTRIGDYTVEDIDDDTVTLGGGDQRIILAAPEPARRSARRPRPTPSATPRELPIDPYAEAAPVDPYAAAPASRSAAAAEAPIDPYTDPALPAIRTVTAPRTIHAGEDGVRVTEAPAATAAATTALPAPETDLPAVDVATPTAPAAPVVKPTALSRSEVNVALADFSKLARMVRGSFTPTGARLDVVAEGSVFAKAGLRAGDIVTAVDGTALTSIDAVADLYIRAATTRAANIDVIRAGAPLTLRVLLY